MRKRIFVLIMSVILIVTFTTGCSSEAQEAMDQAVTTANDLLGNKKNKPLDDKTKEELEKAIKNSEKAKDDDAYTKAKEEVETATKAFQDSVEQLKQVTNPDEAFLLERAKNVKTVTKVEAATEETDANKMLHKEGGYTSYVAMKSSMVKDSYYAKMGPVEAGADGGAVIEAFKTVKQAKSRDEYLGSFDGSGMLSSGSHKVLGTLVVRTSDALTATQQKELEQYVIDALIKLE